MRFYLFFIQVELVFLIGTYIEIAIVIDKKCALI